MPNPRPIQLLPIPHIPEIRPNDNLPRILLTAAKKSKLAFQQNDILVLAQKIISKSENRLIDLTTITPSKRAIDLAAASDNDRSRKDPRLIEIILRESRRIVREHPVLIVETHHGFVCANAGIDQSNIPGENIVSLLPKNPDASAKKIAQALRKLTRKKIAVHHLRHLRPPLAPGPDQRSHRHLRHPPTQDLRGTRDANTKAPPRHHRRHRRRTRRRCRPSHAQIRVHPRRPHPQLQLQAQLRARRHNHPPTRSSTSSANFSFIRPGSAGVPPAILALHC